MPGKDALREYLHEQIPAKGFMSVDYGVTGADLDPLFAQFRDFLDLCYEPGGKQFADAIAFTPTDPTAGGDYYVDRRRIGKINPHSINHDEPSTEDKDVAHIGPRSLERAKNQLGNLPRVMHDFLSSCVELQQATIKALRPVYDALDLEEIMLAPDSLDNQIVTRLLRYLGAATVYKADLHIDRSAFTAANWESSSGLVGAPSNNGIKTPIEVADFDASLEKTINSPIAHRSGELKLFLGAGYNRLPDNIFERNGQLPQLMHGVLNDNPEAERDAVVTFMHPPAGLSGYRIPKSHETGSAKIRARLLGKNEFSEEVA